MSCFRKSAGDVAVPVKAIEAGVRRPWRSWRSWGGVALAAAMLLAAPSGRAQDKAGAHAPDKPFHIFMVQWRGETQTDQGFQDFFRNRRIPVSFTVRNPEQDQSRFPEIVEEIKRVKPDLVYTWSTGSARAIDGLLNDTDPARHITDIPVVNCMVADPTVGGLTKEWGASGRNFTGVSHVPDMESQLRAMKSFRKVSKISTIYDTKQKSPVAAVESLKEMAKKQGIEIQALPLPLDADGKSDVSAIPALVREAAAFKPDFLYIGPDSFLYVNRKPLFDAVNEAHLPTFASADAFLTKGDALFGLVGNYYIVGQYCGSKAARILTEGVNPGDIPFDRLKRFSLRVNMSAAKRLDIYPPMNMLAITDVIKTAQAK